MTQNTDQRVHVAHASFRPWTMTMTPPRSAPLDVEQLRADTPGCAHVVHLNNAGAGLMPRPVLLAVMKHLELEARIGGYEAAACAETELAATYQALADLVGAHPDETALVENATKAWGTVFYGMPFREGDNVITTHASYASNYLAMLQLRRQLGIEIVVAPSDSQGQVDVDALERCIDRNTRLICLTHIPTNSGLVNPAAEVGRVARRHGIPYLLDACQSVGQVDIDMDAIGCDFLSGTGRKYLRGPRGTGFLVVRKTRMDDIRPPTIDLRAADWTSTNAFELQPTARRFESWEGYVAGKIGLGVAARYALALGMKQVEARIAMLGAALREQLAALPGITVHDIGRQKGGIVTFSHRSVSAHDIRSGLTSKKINVHTSGPEWSRLDAEARNLPLMVRASVHAYNTEEELDQCREAVGELTR